MAKLYGKGRIREIEPGKKYHLELSGGKRPGSDSYLRARETFLGTRRAAELRIEEMRKELQLIRDLLEIGIDESDLQKAGLTVPLAIQDGMNAIRVRQYIEDYREKARRSVTFADWCESFLSTREALGEKRANTYKADRAYAKHLVNTFGSMLLSDIKPQAIKEAYAEMKSNGIGATTLRQAHKLFKRIMKEALDNELIDRNPVDAVKTPKRPKPKRDALTVEQAKTIKRVTSSGVPTANMTCVYLGLALGARIGEVLGLEWRHIVLDSDLPPYIHLIQQLLENGKTGPLKTDEDDNPIGRMVPIDAQTIELLKRWKSRQRSLLNELGIEQGQDTPVITNEVGGYCDRHNFSKWFRQFCVDNDLGKWLSDDGKEIVELNVGDDAGLYGDCIIEWRDADGWPCDASGKRYSRSYPNPASKRKRHYSGIVYHQLRHTRFTHGIAQGMTIPVAMALGGWESAAMLNDVYLHATPDGIWSAPMMMESLDAVSA